MPAAKNGGISIHYLDPGGDRPAVVFSHGFLMDHEMFEPQIEALRDDYRCITWDQRGFGATEARGPFTYWDSADDLLAVMDACDVQSATLVGMSQGGFIGMRSALTAPERVRALFLIDTQAGTEEAPMVPVYEGMAQAWAIQPTEDLARTIAGIIIGSAVRRDEPLGSAPLGSADHEPWIAKWLARPGDTITEPFRTLFDRDDIHDQLSQITQPVAIVHGDQDVAISMDKAERLCRELPNCEGLTVIEGGGHAANLSRPDPVNEALRDFLSRHAG
ncbi:MAG: alpha/beta hydrolase [Actinomycetota bacterium]